MIRRDRFTHSRYPYAIDPETFRFAWLSNRDDGTTIYYGRVDAVWFRGKVTSPTANIGHLWDYMTVPAGTEPTLPGFLADWDGRYGGQCVARWDGTTLWGPTLPTVHTLALNMLSPILDAYPEIPAGHTGWWYHR